jgi:hypothetical protein
MLATMTEETLRYPNGRYSWDGPSAVRRRADIDAIETLPAELRLAVGGLSDERLDTPYRRAGWTVRQVVHHLPDSHLNAYVRCKLALTEREPTIHPYDEAAWADLVDSRRTPIGVSLTLLESLHARWVTLLRSLVDEDFQRTFVHPEIEGARTLDWLTGLYAWHGRHHLAHVTSLAERMGW